MISFRARRWRNAALLAVCCFVLLLVEWNSSASIRSTTYWSGWVLCALIIVLALYNVRKKLSHLPLGKVSNWLQWHIYIGWFAIFLLFFHVRWRVANGLLESILYTLFLVVAFSGIVGLIISRSYSRRLTTYGPEEIFEQIPRLQQKVYLESERLVLQCVQQNHSSAISELYSDHLRSFFSRSRNHLWHLLLSRRPSRQLLTQIESHRQFLNDDEKVVLDQLYQNVQIKDNLDFQFVHQWVLKHWLFIHVPLTYALLVFITFHAILVHAFSGDIQ